jgi:hypothetical protein
VSQVLPHELQLLRVGWVNLAHAVKLGEVIWRGRSTGRQGSSRAGRKGRCSHYLASTKGCIKHQRSSRDWASQI